MERPIQHEDASRGGTFFIEQDGRRVAELTYRRSGDSLVVIDHTEVDVGLRGQGIARSLLDAAVKWARASNTRVIPTCSYAVALFARDPSIRDVLA